MASSRSASATTDLIGGMTSDERHLVRRFSFGFDDRLVAQVSSAGGVQPWFEAQLTPASVPDPRGDEVATWYPNLALTPQQIYARWLADHTSITPATLSQDLVRATLMRRVRSARHVQEVMTDFWSNLLHVASPSSKNWVVRPAYDAVLRANALGRFDDLLKAAVLHPAMLMYLDAHVSTAAALNENLGRELLELHTVGRTAGYGEPDVLSSARILTGWWVDYSKTWNQVYRPGTHYVGPVQVMDFGDANGAADGRTTTYSYLSYLAHHPATAQRIARRLVTRFVSDTPSPTLVDDIAAAFSSSGTDIKTTLRALVAHPEFVSSSAPKVRTPAEDYVAACRELRIEVSPPTAATDFGAYCFTQEGTIGPVPFDWSTPDGFPDVSDAWASAGRMLGSWNVHHALARGSVTGGATYRPVSTWLPALPVPFDQLVNSVSTLLLLEPATPALVAAAAAAVGVTGTETITAKHPVVTSRMPLLLALLLDSPLHLNR